MQYKKYSNNIIMCSIFILCYNEELLLPYTIKHYKQSIPNCKITIMDNKSTDNSVKIAKELGCDVIEWCSNRWDGIDDQKYIQIKNNCWKNAEDGWIIMCDMDEWLCITQEELKNEKVNGTTILTTKGYEMMGESNEILLSDIDLFNIKKGFFNKMMSKKLCFYKSDIKEINYRAGAHTCNPIGNIKYSNKEYIIKHMNYLGLSYYIDKILKRNERNKHQREKLKNVAGHYNTNIVQMKKRYNNFLRKSKIIF